ncbi:MAG TPA: hypothetical protein VGW38_10665, partial [Chloroflexota bacterium]|nr:hypothetical protein [Chloroflexota bacterium]
VEAVGEVIASGVYEPLELDVPTLQVDTTVGGPPAPLTSQEYTPSYARVLDFIRTAARTS